MIDSLKSLFDCIQEHDEIGEKEHLTTLIRDAFHLEKDRTVYHCANFAIRFTAGRSDSANFSNTVLALSRLRKYDERPFIVCHVTPNKNLCFIANSTFLKKVSHSSHELREDNIRGSFNGSDIVRNFEGIENKAENIGRLFAIHSKIGFEGNLPRLVEVTKNISSSGIKFGVSDKIRSVILSSPKRAIEFMKSADFKILETDLDDKVAKYRDGIVKAADIENNNHRGRIIEYLIAGDDENLKQNLTEALRSQRKIPKPKTSNTLGDYQKKFRNFDVDVDVKTKIIILDSNPKSFNLDKMLQFLSREKSVFMFYFVGIDEQREVNTVLVSMFQKDLLRTMGRQPHWSGRNSRGVSQLDGRVINMLIKNPSYEIDSSKAEEFLEEWIGS